MDWQWRRNRVYLWQCTVDAYAKCFRTCEFCSHRMKWFIFCVTWFASSWLWRDALTTTIGMTRYEKKIHSLWVGGSFDKYQRRWIGSKHLYHSRQVFNSSGGWESSSSLLASFWYHATKACLNVWKKNETRSEKKSWPVEVSEKKVRHSKQD